LEGPNSSRLASAANGWQPLPRMRRKGCGSAENHIGRPLKKRLTTLAIRA
jgi:hypothetical protein